MLISLGADVLRGFGSSGDYGGVMPIYAGIQYPIGERI